MNILEKTIKYGIYLALILPLIFTSRTMYPWHFGKTLLFQGLIEILLLLALIYFGLNKERKFIKLNKLDWLILIFLILQIISAVLGVNFNRSFWGDQQRVQGIFTWMHFVGFYFLMRQFFTIKKDWQNLVIWVLSISFVSCLLAFFGPHFSFFDDIISNVGRISGLIGNPIFFASYVIIPIFLGLAWFWYLDKSNKWRYFALFSSLVAFIGLFLSGTKGALVGLGAGFFASWVIYLILNKSEKARKISLVVGFLFIALFASVYAINQKTDYIKNISPSLSNILAINISNTTASTRLMAWKIAFQGWQDHPIFGWGGESFQDIFDKHYNPEFLKYSLAETIWDKPHSYPLEVLATMGLIGFSCYLLIIFYAVYYSFAVSRNKEINNEKLPFIILAGAVIAFVVQSAFGIETSNSLQLWFLLLAFVSFAYNEKQISVYSQDRFYKILSWMALIFMVVTPILIYKNYTFFKASVAMGDTKDAAEIDSLYLWKKNALSVMDIKVPFMWEQATLLSRDLSIFDGKAILNRETLEPVAPRLAEIFEQDIKKYPTSYLMRFWGGQLYSFMGEIMDKKYYDRSEQLFKEALNMNTRRQNVILTLAKNYLLQGRTEEAVNLLEETLKQGQDYEEIHWFLGLALIESGQKDRGMEELEKGKDFGTSSNVSNIQYVIDLYAEREEYEKIVPLYERLISLDPKNPQYYASLAATYVKLNDKENVIININKAVELQPELIEGAKKFLKENNIEI